MFLGMVSDDRIGNVRLQYYRDSMAGMYDTTQTYAIQDGELVLIGGDVIDTLDAFRKYREGIKMRQSQEIKGRGSELPCKLCGDSLQIYGFISDPAPWAHIDCLKRFLTCGKELAKEHPEAVTRVI